MKKSFLIFLVGMLIGSCDIPNSYFSPTPNSQKTINVIDENEDISHENQQLIRDKLRKADSGGYRYFFKFFLEEGSRTYMITNFKNNEFSFDVKVLVTKWDKLGGMHKTNGVSYPNELHNLQWDIMIVDGMEEVVYQDMHRIID